MKRLRRALSSLRLRLSLWYVAVLGIILVAFSVVLYNAVRIGQFRELNLGLVASAEVLQNRLGGRLTPLDLPRPEELPLRQEIFYQVVVLLGGVTVRSDNLQGLSLPLHEAARLAVLNGQAHLEDVRLAPKLSVRLLTQPYRFSLGGAIIGYLQVAVSLQEVQKNLRQIRFWLWVIVPLTLVLTSLGGAFLADRLLHPLAQMSARAREISGQHLNRRLPVYNPQDELGRLATTLNELFDRLERAFKNQQRFIADASHELRTPLAAMRAELEVALRHARSPEEYLAILTSALDEVKRLSRLAERLLFLAQSDAGELPLQRRTVQLEALCRRTLDKLAPLARDKGLALSLQNTPSAPVRGDEELLEQVVTILVENALKYTPAGGQVRLACGTEGAQAWLEVADTGPGISPEHLPHLFERFYRVDKARSRRLGGSGLGLSIARSIVLAHGGTITVTSRPGEGSRFRLRLPGSLQPTFLNH